MAIETPVRGTPLRASWAADVTDAVNALAPMSAPGLLARQGMGGTGFARVPENRRGQALTGVSLFAIRKVVQGNDAPTVPYTGWEIYMPNGCVSVGATCQALNPRAYRTVDGETVYEEGWYRLACPADEPDRATSWPVVVHAKCCAALEGVDTFSEWPKRYVWAEMQNDPGEMTQSEHENAVFDVGDTFSATVGTVIWTFDDSLNASWAYSQGVRAAITVRETVATAPMALLFAFSVYEDDVELSLERIFVRNQTFSAAGATFIAADLFEVNVAHEAVYLVVNTATTPYTATLQSFASVTSGNTTLTVPAQVQANRQPGQIWVQLYGLKNGHVTLDNLSALNNLQIYQ